eukprot:scaffold16454_cov117-Isochrysis_galbana.AAC.1
MCAYARVRPALGAPATGCPSEDATGGSVPLVRTPTYGVVRHVSSMYRDLPSLAHQHTPTPHPRPPPAPARDAAASRYAHDTRPTLACLTEQYASPRRRLPQVALLRSPLTARAHSHSSVA